MATVEYKVHFILMGIIYWIFSAILFYSASMYFKHTYKLYWIAAAIFCLIGICMLLLPFYIYLNVSRLDNSIQLLDFKADSLRKIGQ
jgi:ABC-type antimicrobial peptide transport system permease subunit